MIRVTFADGATEDRDDDTDCRPDPYSDFVSSIHLHRGSRVEVKRGDIWDDCHVETFEEQIARLTAELDATHQKYVLRDAWALLWKGWAREFWEEKREAWRTLRSLRDAARSACDREMGEGHRYPENVKVSTLVAHLNTMDFGHAEKVRADAAEKRLADLRAWALKERGAVRDRGAAEAARGEDLAAAWCDGEAAALGELLQYIDGFPLREAVEWAVARIDGKDGESK